MVRGPHTAMKSGPCSLQLEKALAQKRRPNTAINKQTNKQTNLNFFKKKKNSGVGNGPASHIQKLGHTLLERK